MTLSSEFFLADCPEAVRRGLVAPAWTTADIDALYLAVLGEALTGRRWDAFLIEMNEMPLHKDDDSERITGVPDGLTAALAGLEETTLPAFVKCLETNADGDDARPADTERFLCSLRALCQQAVAQNKNLYLVTRL